MPTFWDKSKGIYRGAKGKEIPYMDVRNAVHKVADDAKQRLRDLAQQFVDKKIDPPTWYTQSEPIVRKGLIASGQIGAGGRAQMTPSLNGSLGSKVRFHLGKWREFSFEVERGELTAAQIVSRVEMYADSISGVYEQVRKDAMVAAGFTEAKNVLSDSVHCKECPAIVGWIKIENYKPPGTRACLSRCRCGTEYR
jgi:hypothetical protein